MLGLARRGLGIEVGCDKTVYANLHRNGKGWAVKEKGYVLVTLQNTSWAGPAGVLPPDVLFRVYLAESISTEGGAQGHNSGARIVDSCEIVERARLTFRVERQTGFSMPFS